MTQLFLGIVSVVGALLVALIFFNVSFLIIAGVLIALVLFAVLVIALIVRRNYVIVGTGPTRFVALEIFLGKPQRLLSVGDRMLRIPAVRDLWKVPTGNYYFTREAHGHTKDNYWAVMTLRIDIHWPTPSDPGSPLMFHFPKEDQLTLGGSKRSYEDVVGVNPFTDWGAMTSKELLLKAYYRFPTEPMKVSTEYLSNFFGGPVEAMAITVMGQIDRADLLFQQHVVEDAIKKILLMERGDPFVECGIPAECVSISIMRIEPTEEMKQSLNEPQAARNTGEAARIRAHYARESSSDEATRIRNLVLAYTESGAGPIIGPILAEAQVKGSELPLDKLMMLSIITQQFGGRIPSPDEIIKQLSPAQLLVLQQRIQGQTT